LIINHPLAATLERIRLTQKLFLGYLGILIAAAGSSVYFVKNIYGLISAVILIIIALAMLYWYFSKAGRRKLKANWELMEKEYDDDELIKKKLRDQGTHETESFGSRLIHGIVPFGKLIPVYDKYLKLAICTRKRRWTVLTATLVIFVGAVLLPITGIVPTEFFPASDFENIFISIEAPVGLNLDKTDKIVRRVEETLLKYPEIVNFSTVVGKEGISPNSGGSGIQQDASHLASIVITIAEKKDRQITSYVLADNIRQDLGNIQEAVINVESPRGGPPSGAAFEARIVGDDLQTLDRVSKELKPILSSIPGVINIDTSLKEAPAEYTLSLDPIRMEFYNLNAAYVGSIMRMAISGLETSTVIKANKEIKIMARFDEDKIPDLEAVQNLQIQNLQGNPVFIKDVAKVELKPSVDSITRIDQKRAVLLSAGVEGETRPNAVLAEFQKKLEKEYKLPEGYSIIYGGENEQNQESVISILRAMVIAAILIISTLVIQFNSFKKAMIVLVTLPLALIGVFIGMAILRINLSFPGLIGILALFGIVVKNAIILIDKINLNLRTGIPYYDSIIDAGKSRLEAIFITSICTIFGIIPVTLSNELWMALGTAIIFGLMLSSIFTLIIVPTLFVTFIGEKERF
jgi:HAE1 family hydrophobic/amphiphilic exporter-1